MYPQSIEYHLQNSFKYQVFSYVDGISSNVIVNDVCIYNDICELYWGGTLSSR